MATSLLILVGSSPLIGLAGCSGSSQHKTGDLVPQDEAVTKRTAEMADYYKKNPLSTTPTNSSGKAAGDMAEFYKKNPLGGKPK